MCTIQECNNGKKIGSRLLAQKNETYERPKSEFFIFYRTEKRNSDFILAAFVEKLAAISMFEQIMP